MIGSDRKAHLLTGRNRLARVADEFAVKNKLVKLFKIYISKQAKIGKMNWFNLKLKF